MAAKVFTQSVCTLAGVQVRLRDLRRSDGARWRAFRIANEQELRRVEPTVEGDWALAHSKWAWRDTYSFLNKSRRQGLLFPLAIEAEGEFVGQVTIGSIQHGSISNCWIGYWVDSNKAGKGIATAATALGTDFAIRQLGIHRVEATVMEDNPASIAVLRKTGFRVEGRLERNLHINGVWQDHLLVAQTKEESAPGGVVQKLIDSGRLLPDLEQ